MAQFEKPINMIDEGDKIEHRQEEEYMHKYMKMKPRKVKPEPMEADEDASEDPELEAFADKEI